jgi:hypothetical protein
MSTSRQQAADAAKQVQAYLSLGQLKALCAATQGEEGSYFLNKFVELDHKIKQMPATGEQEGLGKQAVVHLHYFHGASDWYILEKDIEDGVSQAYGYALLNGDHENAEYGYVSITELVENGVELDLYFKSQALSAILEAKLAA